MRIYDAKEVPAAYKVAFYDTLAKHFADTIDGYYTRDVEPDPRYDSGVEPAERTEAVLMEVGEGKDAGDLFVVMEVEGWVDFLGFRVELPTLTRDAMEWEGGGPEIEDRFGVDQADAIALRNGIIDYLECPTCHGEGVHWTDVLGEAVLDDLAALREKLSTLVYFYRHGYSQQAVWALVKQDADHPAWIAYLEGGTSAVARWSYETAEALLAAPDAAEG